MPMGGDLCLLLHTLNRSQSRSMMSGRKLAGIGRWGCRIRLLRLTPRLTVCWTCCPAVDDLLLLEAELLVACEVWRIALADLDAAIEGRPAC